MVRNAGNKAVLLDAIWAGSFDPKHLGPIVVSLILWDGRKVYGSCYKDRKNPT